MTLTVLTFKFAISQVLILLLINYFIQARPLFFIGSVNARLLLDHGEDRLLVVLIFAKIVTGTSWVSGRELLCYERVSNQMLDLSNMRAFDPDCRW